MIAPLDRAHDFEVAVLMRQRDQTRPHPPRRTCNCKVDCHFYRYGSESILTNRHVALVTRHVHT
jgi:hypothetical protein